MTKIIITGIGEVKERFAAIDTDEITREIMEDARADFLKKIKSEWPPKKPKRKQINTLT